MAAPTCKAFSPKHKDLTNSLIKLRQQKDELEVKLNGESCNPDPLEEQLDNIKFALAQLNEKIENLKAAKAEMEGKIKCLQGRSAERSSAIETLSQFAEAEKAKLKEEFEQLTKVLQEETEGRISAQGQFESPDDICPLTPGQAAGPPNPFHVDTSPSAASSPYAYPTGGSVERPARYLHEHMRYNPVRPIPFPNDAMDEAEGFYDSQY